MPNGKSLYSTFAGASAAEGKVQAAETAVRSIQDLMKGELQIMDWGQGQTQKAIGAVSEGLSLMSTLYGGWESKKEFETAKTGVQSQIARESYTGEDYESFIGTTEGKEYLESFAPVKEGSMYKFGEGENRYSLGKGAISGIGTGAQYGVKADLSMYKEAAQAAPPAATSDPASTPSGEFYGEKKGFDLGDIVGEKSIFAAGKEKLSSILSKPPSPEQKSTSTPVVSTVEDVVEEVAAPALDWGDDDSGSAYYGSKKNPFIAKGVGDVFKLAKAAGMKPSGQTLYSKWGEGDVMSWEYKFGD